MSNTEFAENWLAGPTGTNFYTRTYTPATATKAVLVFVHGFIEHIARYEHVFPSYAQHGIAVFAFDQRGFGRTALDPGPDGKWEKARESRKEGYGRTSSDQQKQDIDWALRYAGEKLGGWNDAKNLPVFLMGHSMGGCLVLSFGASPPSSLPQRLAGVIATSPFLAQTRPASKILRKLGGLGSTLTPWTTIPAGVKAGDLSHDKVVSDAYLTDPLVQQYGTLKGVSTMLNLGDNLSANQYKTWPIDLPVLLCHGTDDQVASYTVVQKFYDDIKANDKTFSPYEGGFHELQNEPELKKRLIDEVTAWIDKHVPRTSDAVSDTPDARL